MIQRVAAVLVHNTAKQPIGQPVAGRVIVMVKGQLVFKEPPKALQARPDILERFLGV
jgi:ABC-type branched-subunit amino acid transport system ATPase component